MPTTKPRVQVTLEPETHAVIERFAQLQGRSRGGVISELLDSINPALIRTVALLEAASAAPDKVKSGLKSVVEGIHSELLSASGESSKQLDMILDLIEQRDDDQQSDPHVVTRGSGTTKPRGPTAKKRAATRTNTRD